MTTEPEPWRGARRIDPRSDARLRAGGSPESPHPVPRSPPPGTQRRSGDVQEEDHEQHARQRLDAVAKSPFPHIHRTFHGSGSSLKRDLRQPGVRLRPSTEPAQRGRIPGGARSVAQRRGTQISELARCCPVPLGPADIVLFIGRSPRRRSAVTHRVPPAPNRDRFPCARLPASRAARSNVPRSVFGCTAIAPQPLPEHLHDTRRRGPLWVRAVACARSSVSPDM
jgi:hypothetical protein